MAVSAKVYANSPSGQFSVTAARRVDWVTDTIKVMLATSTYAVSQTAHIFKSDVTNEITGTGYTAGGVTLGSKTNTVATLATQLDAADASWTTATFTARYAIVYKDTGVAATSPVLGYVDFGADATATAGTFTIVWDATGILVYTVA